MNLSIFSRARRSDSLQATGSANAQTFRSQESKDDLTGSMKFGPTWSAHGSTTYELIASELPEVKRMVVLTATKKLFTERYFSISKLREIAKILGAPEKGKPWQLLQPLHCVDYDDMQPELREAIPHLVNECLTSHIQAAHDTCIALKGVEI